MQARHGRRRGFQLSEKRDPPGLERRHLVLDGSAGHSRLDRFDQPANLALGLLQIAFGVAVSVVSFGPQPVYLSVELLNKSGDHLRMHELRLQPFQHFVLEFLTLNAEEIVAGALIAGGGAPVMRLTDFRKATAAASALEEAREKIVRASCTLRTHALVLGDDP
ncbi:MAG: hypothetical protein WD852_02005 [Methyloceanibacter sp.]